MRRHVRIGTRGSLLARTQAEGLCQNLRNRCPDVEFELVTIKTGGDQVQEKTFGDFGYKGVFTREIDQALVEGRIDAAIHSLKDLPSSLLPELELGAVTECIDPRDAVISKGSQTLAKMKEGGVVGTASLRRQAQLAHHMPHLTIQVLRGNLDTRLARLDAGDYDAIIVAAAGVLRLERADRIAEYLDPQVFVPAMGQGRLAMTCRKDDSDTLAALATVNDVENRPLVDMERTFLKEMEGGCQVPMGCFARRRDATAIVTGFLSLPDGSKFVQETLEGAVQEGSRLGQQLVERILSGEGREIQKQLRSL